MINSYKQKKLEEFNEKFPNLKRAVYNEDGEEGCYLYLETTEDVYKFVSSLIDETENQVRAENDSRQDKRNT